MTIILCAVGYMKRVFIRHESLISLIEICSEVSRSRPAMSGVVIRRAVGPHRQSLPLCDSSMVSESMHEISACKPRIVQPFFVAVLVCRRFDQAPKYAGHSAPLGNHAFPVAPHRHGLPVRIASS